MLKIKKIINNNIVIALDVKGKEQILMGRGLGFNKKIGEQIDSALVEKKYTSQDKEEIEGYNFIFEHIPPVYIEIAQQIIEHAQISFSTIFNSRLCIALIDHIHFSIQRFKKGLVLKNNMLWEIETLYPEEYNEGTYASKLLNKEFEIILPKDEVGFLALHFITGRFRESLETVFDITKMLQEVLTIIKLHFKKDFNKNDFEYQRLVTHIKFFAQRIIKPGNQKTVTPTEDELFVLIKSKYKKAFNCATIIGVYYFKNYQYKLTNDDLIYLSVHIQRVAFK